MTKLLEYKARAIEILGEYESYIMPFAKFLFALIMFSVIQGNLKFNSHLNNVLLLLIMSLVCALLPVRAMLWFAAGQILLDLASLSMAALAVTFVIFIILFLLYYRFAPKDELVTILTPLAFKLHVPYAMPVSCGLLRGPYSFFSVICGTVIYYLLDGISSHSSEIKEMESSSDAEMTDKLNIVLEQIVGNKDLYLVLVIFTITAIMTYVLRRIQADQAWTLAIVSGILLQLLGLFVGYLVLHVTGKTTWLLLGNILSLGICFVIQFICMNLDYSRVERVQFEDDDYYYYVKAVPKKNVAYEQKTVKHFGGREKSEKNTRRNAPNVNLLEPEEESLDGKETSYAPAPKRSSSGPLRTAPESPRTSTGPLRTAPESPRTSTGPLRTAPESPRTSTAPLRTAPVPRNLDDAEEIRKIAQELNIDLEELD